MSLFYSLTNYLRQYALIKIILNIFRHTKGMRIPCKWYLYLYFIHKDFSIPLHGNIRKNAQKLIAQGINVGDLYLAQSLFLQNKLDKAEHHVLRFCQAYPCHAEGLYLLSEIKYRNNQKEEAFDLLKKFLQQSQRGKTWQYLSNLVETKADFDRFYELFVNAHNHYGKKPLSYDLSCHLSTAATRAQQTTFVLNFWRKQYCLLCQNPPTQPAKPPTSRQYSDKKAAQALSDLKNFFDLHQIDFFLISGTLLGCIREGKLLGHDKDIDIGIWETHSVSGLANKIYSSGCFYVLPIYSPDILVIRHVNGITIDIFIHYREENDYWHAGGKSKWHNSPFELTSRPFLNGHYLIPADYDLYLTENYGDWRTPQLSFDSALDTPNMEIISQDEFLIYLYKKITFSLHTGKRPSERYLSVLREYGEHLD
ncbi:capZB protein [Neisseria weixii]|uniref:capZB protein n=1 Tax=Neisseria weixii TaxID=1853276 RepID=UPI0018F509DF|nr:capZB protein [Neisseria weixii]